MQPPPISKILLGGFRATATWLFNRQFGGLWVQEPENWQIPTGPLVVYSNHPNWWDPIIANLLARHYFPERRHYFPMDADPMKKHPGFSKMGFLPVDRTKPAGTRRFLLQARSILADSNCVLWVTPQGQLTDHRTRPIKILPGLQRIINENTQMLPIAVEYSFWNEKKPEALVKIGKVHSGCGFSDTLAANNLSNLLNELSISSQKRQYADFKRIPT